ILSSDQKWQKRYCVQVEGQPDDKALEPLRQGLAIRINGEVYKTRPALIRILDKPPDLPPREPPIRVRKEIPTSWVEISLVEGKNRQVRKMMAAIGFPVLRLTRMAIGPITLEGLLPGDILELQKPFWLI
ncbi:MAG TPA: pseudouridine synthase, partial [Saprospiraceae bacterium]|nr:pseudouridine synthase [Saprospiraceae bacterium]